MDAGISWPSPHGGDGPTWIPAAPPTGGGRGSPAAPWLSPHGDPAVIVGDVAHSVVGPAAADADDGAGRCDCSGADG